MTDTGRTVSTADASARNRTLDAVRFALIAAVMAYHYTIRWTPPHNPHDLYHYGTSYSPYFEIGLYGVHVFFMLSGYFVAIALDRYSDAVAFLYRRVIRIYPAFLVCCTLTFALGPVMPAQFRVGAWDYILSLGFVAENVGARFVDGAYWSLAVEMKFYLFACLLFALLGRRYWIGLIGVGAAGALLGLVAPKAAKEILLAPYMPMFLAGVGLAHHAAFRRGAVAVPLYAVSAALLALHRDTFALHGEPSGLVAACVAGAMILVVLVACSGIDVALGPLPYLGVISYEIYLLHQKIGVAIIGAARDGLGLSDLGAMLLAAAAVVAGAAFVHEVLQKPVRAALVMLWTSGWSRIRRRDAGAVPGAPARVAIRR